jgi:hypothetical protein
MFCVAQSLRDPPNVEGTNLCLFVLNQSRTLSLDHRNGSPRQLSLSQFRHWSSTAWRAVLLSGALK